MTEVKSNAVFLNVYATGADETIQWEIMYKLNQRIYRTAAYEDYVMPVEKIIEEFGLFLK